MTANERRSERSIATFRPTIRVPAYVVEDAQEQYRRVDRDCHDFDGRQLLEEFITDRMVNWEYARKLAVRMTCVSCGNRWSFAGIGGEPMCPGCGRVNSDDLRGKVSKDPSGHGWKER